MKGWCELVTFVGRGVRFRQNKKNMKGIIFMRMQGILVHYFSHDEAAAFG